jgi:hypothetical protein
MTISRLSARSMLSNPKTVVQTEYTLGSVACAEMDRMATGRWFAQCVIMQNVRIASPKFNTIEERFRVWAHRLWFLPVGWERFGYSVVVDRSRLCFTAFPDLLWLTVVRSRGGYMPTDSDL